jgi:hypothetical protein
MEFMRRYSSFLETNQLNLIDYFYKNFDGFSLYSLDTGAKLGLDKKRIATFKFINEGIDGTIVITF